MKGDQPEPYNPKCLSAVYFGVNMNKDIKTLIANGLRNSVRLYEMRKSSDKYHLVFEPL
jgi:hypothetical protein